MNNETQVNRTGLWVRETKNGKKFMGGLLKIDEKEYSIRIFKNEKKEKNTQPDYNLFFDLKEEQNTVKEVQEEDKTVKLTDEDYDNLLKQNEVEEEQLELPF